MMREVFNSIRSALRYVLGELFCSDMAVMSTEVLEILSNKEDAKMYKDAIKRVQSGGGPVRVVFSDGRVLTLI